MTAVHGPTALPYACVIVHFQNDAVYEVVAQLEGQTERPTRVWLVDNSADVDATRLPPTSFPVEILPPAGNRGYAAAVDAVRPLVGSTAFLLVLTHEVQLEPDCAALLVSALRADPLVGNAGPVLGLRSRPEEIFSSGGDLDGWLWPRHRHDRATGAAVDAAWIDGSVMMLRVAALEEVDWLDESYFLYYEEIDLALRLRAVRQRTVVVSGAVARQEPGDFPPFLANRNRLILARRHRDALHAPVALLALRMLAEIAWTARRRGARTVVPALRGLLAGVRGRSGRPGPIG